MTSTTLWISYLFLPCILFICNPAYSQDLSSEKLEGRVYSDDGDVAATHVLNTTTERATITDINGYFAIPAKLNGILVFSALHYKRKELVVSYDVLESKLLLVPLEAESNVTKNTPGPNGYEISKWIPYTRSD